MTNKPLDRGFKHAAMTATGEACLAPTLMCKVNAFSKSD